MTERSMKERGRESGSERHGGGENGGGGGGWKRRKSGGREGRENKCVFGLTVARIDFDKIDFG